MKLNFGHCGHNLAHFGVSALSLVHLVSLAKAQQIAPNTGGDDSQQQAPNDDDASSSSTSTTQKQLFPDASNSDAFIYVSGLDLGDEPIDLWQDNKFLSCTRTKGVQSAVCEVSAEDTGFLPTGTFSNQDYYVNFPEPSVDLPMNFRCQNKKWKMWNREHCSALGYVDDDYAFYGQGYDYFQIAQIFVLSPLAEQ